MLGETLASTYPVVPAAIARRGVPADSRTRRDVCFNISRRPHATVRRGVPAVPAELGYSCKTFSVVCLIVVDYQFGVEFLVSWLAQWGEVP